NSATPVPIRSDERDSRGTALLARPKPETHPAGHGSVGRPYGAVEWSDSLTRPYGVVMASVTPRAKSPAPHTYPDPIAALRDDIRRAGRRAYRLGIRAIALTALAAFPFVLVSYLLSSVFEDGFVWFALALELIG